MSERGVFAVDRGIWDHPSFPRQPFTGREAFIWLVSEASYRPRKSRVGSVVLDLDRGQVAHSYRFLAQRWQWTLGKVQRFLKHLETDTMIETRADTGALVITVCNYNKYQRVSLPADTVADTPRDMSPIRGRYRLEDKENKKDILLCDQAAPEERDDRRNGRVPDGDHPAKPTALTPAKKATIDDFERFWRAYPKRDGGSPKDPARKKFNVCVQSGAVPDLIIAGAAAFATAEHKRGNIGTRFIPHASTWLGRRGWEDHEASPSANPAAEAESWRMPVESWHRDPSTWNSHAWGPPPHEAGCKVPQSVLADFASTSPARRDRAPLIEERIQ